MQPASAAEEARQAFIDRRDPVPRELAEHPANPSLVDGPKAIDERE